MPTTAVNFIQVRRIAAFASMRRLPSFCAWREFADPATCRSFKIAGPKAAVEQCKDKALIRQRLPTQTAAGAVRIGAPRRSARPGSR